ncbi:MAG: hypothetical protein IT477_10350 [Rhodanobacteraceae bacterium]|nr:hypothetical protein [Rhodanobacteraceae bacterium]
MLDDRACRDLKHQICCTDAVAKRALETAQEAIGDAAAAAAAAAAAQGTATQALGEATAAAADAELALLLSVEAVPDLTALAALPVTGFVEGKLVYVETVRDYFSWSAGALGVYDGITTLAGTAGYWQRKNISALSWKYQSTWYIDGTNGNDENSGALNNEAIRTWAEWVRRIGNPFLPVNITMFVIVLATPPDHLNLTYSRPQNNTNGDLYIFGTPTVVGTPATITNFVAMAGAASTIGTVTVDDPNFVTPGQDGATFIRYGGGTATYSVLMENGTTNSFSFNRRYDQAGNAQGDPAIGTTVEKVTMTGVRINRLASARPGGVVISLCALSTDNGQIQEGGSLENVSVYNCFVNHMALNNGEQGNQSPASAPLVIGCCCSQTQLNGVYLRAGMLKNNCRNVGAKTQLTEGIQLGGRDDISPFVGLIIDTGLVNCVQATTGNTGVGSGTAGVEIGSGAAMVLTTNNSFFGGNKPLRIRPNGTLRRASVTGVSSNKPGTAVEWPTAANPVAVTRTNTFTAIVNNTWSAVNGYNLAGNSQVWHALSGARICTSTT